MVEDEGKSFVVKMLDLCKNSDEAVSLLTTDNKLDHYFKPEVLLLNFFDLKGVFAKNERGYRLNAIKKRF